MNSNYEKYLKYKSKYFNLRNELIGGVNYDDININDVNHINEMITLMSSIKDIETYRTNMENLKKILIAFSKKPEQVGDFSAFKSTASVLGLINGLLNKQQQKLNIEAAAQAAAQAAADLAAAANQAAAPGSIGAQQSNIQIRMPPDNITACDELIEDIINYITTLLGNDGDDNTDLRQVIKLVDNIKVSAESLKQERDTLIGEKATVEQERDTLIGEKATVEQEKATLKQERDDLKKERDNIESERDAILITNGDLIELLNPQNAQNTQNTSTLTNPQNPQNAQNPNLNLEPNRENAQKIYQALMDDKTDVQTYKSIAESIVGLLSSFSAKKLRNKFGLS
jgi:hypothetical protein